ISNRDWSSDVCSSDLTIDELLSGEELITLAETENRSNLKKIYSFIYGILDMMAVTFILLPLYGNLVDGYNYSVNLLSFTDTTPKIGRASCRDSVYIAL